MPGPTDIFKKNTSLRKRRATKRNFQKRVTEHQQASTKTFYGSLGGASPVRRIDPVMGKVVAILNPEPGPAQPKPTRSKPGLYALARPFDIGELLGGACGFRCCRACQRQSRRAANRSADVAALLSLTLRMFVIFYTDDMRRLVILPLQRPFFSRCPSASPLHRSRSLTLRLLVIAQ